LILEPDRPRRRTWLVPYPTIGSVAISPDDRWVATGGRGLAPSSRELHIWDASSGRLLATLEVGNAMVAFSHDGRWLGVGGPGRYRFFRAGSWQPVAEVEHGLEVGAMPLAFHPGGRVAAVVEQGRGVVRLVEVETGGVLASFEPPDPSPTHTMAFSPDGRYLVMSQADQRLHIWDLALIRCRLDELGLAVSLPDIFGGDSATSAASDTAAIDRIEVVGADPAGLVRLAIRHILQEGWFALRGMFDVGLGDPEELLARGGR